MAAVERVRASDPTNYLKLISNVLPREILVQAFSVHAEGTIESLERIEGVLSAYRYAQERIDRGGFPD